MIIVSEKNSALIFSPLSRNDKLRGLMLLLSLILFFVSISSADNFFGLFSFLISLFFVSITFWKGPIAVNPKYLLDKYSDYIGFYLDRGEARLCKILNATKKSDVVLVGVAYNFMVVMAVVLPIDMLFQYLTRGANSLLLYQKAITQIVYHLELLLGTDIYVRGEHSTILAYRNSIDMEIVAECTGLHETIFLALLILCFRGVKPSVRIKWAFYAALFFFTENIIRILSGYHLIMRYGFTTWDKFHFFWWHTGQYALIMSVFLLWIMIIASKPDNKSPKKSY